MDNEVKELIERVEARIEGYIAQTNNKLDLLIDLTRQMAVMQATQNHQANELTRLNTRVAEIDAEVKASLLRVHTRVDECQSLHHGEAGEIYETIKKHVADGWAWKEAGDKARQEISAKVDSHLAWVKGAWFAVALGALLVPTVASKYYGDITTSIQSLQSKLDMFVDKERELEQQLMLHIRAQQQKDTEQESKK